MIKMSSGSKIRPRPIPVVTLKSSCYFQSYSYINKGTQTVKDHSSNYHSQQINQLLTEVAVALGHKAKLENEISEMKEDVSKMRKIFDETGCKLEQEVKKLKRENFEKEMELSKLKISYLEEQKTLLNQVSTLKSVIQNLNHENEIITKHLKNKNEKLELNINLIQEELKKEGEKNVQLQLKVTKYKNKFKNLVNYIQHLVQDCKHQQRKDIQTETDKKIPDKDEPDVEDLVLTELFFKPGPFPVEVEDIFFNQKA